MNKSFKTCRRTTKECEQRWRYLNVDLTICEELLTTLSFYHGTLGKVSDVLEMKINENEYIGKLFDQASKKAAQHESIENISPLLQLQLLVCADAALSSVKDPSLDALNKAKVADQDWLELAKKLAKMKEDLTPESVHKYADRVVSMIEDKIQTLVNVEEGLSEVMHQRREVPSQERIAQRANCLFPFLTNEYEIIALYYPRPHPPSNC